MDKVVGVKNERTGGLNERRKNTVAKNDSECKSDGS